MKKIAVSALLFMVLLMVSACGNNIENTKNNSLSNFESSHSDELESKVSSISENKNSEKDELTDMSLSKKNESLDEDIQVSVVSDDISAYEIAQKNGFKGTSEEWINSLKNQKADDIISKYGVKEIAENHKNKEIDSIIKDAKVSTTGNLEIELDNGTFIDIGRKVSNENNSKKYTVRFLDYDGTEIKTENISSGESANVPEDPKREGYVFTGWDKTFDKINEDIIVKAQYVKNSDPFFIVEKVTAAAGQNNISVKVSFNNSPGISSLKMKLSFDKSLNLKKVEYNSVMDGLTMIPEYYASPVTLNWINPFSEIKGDNTIATLYFDLDESSEGTIPINITYDEDDVYNSKEKNIKFAVVDGGVVIE